MHNYYFTHWFRFTTESNLTSTKMKSTNIIRLTEYKNESTVERVTQRQIKAAVE